VWIIIKVILWIIFIVIVFLRETVTESPTRERMWQELSSINIGPKGDIHSPSGATIFLFQNGRDLCLCHVSVAIVAEPEILNKDTKAHPPWPPEWPDAP